jgi:2-iminobutanoate/2-iminopropanoate deaminase
MSKTAITSPELTPPVGPFSQAIEVGGFLFFSGQVAQDPATEGGRGGIVPETERVFQNLSAVLKAAGKGFDDVVRAGVYLTNMSYYVALNGIYAKHFSQPFPEGSHSLIGVHAAVRCRRNPRAFPPRLMRQSTGPGANPQFRFDRKIRTFRFGNST